MLSAVGNHHDKNPNFCTVNIYETSVRMTKVGLLSDLVTITDKVLKLPMRKESGNMGNNSHAFSILLTCNKVTTVAWYEQRFFSHSSTLPKCAIVNST